MLQSPLLITECLLRAWHPPGEVWNGEEDGAYADVRKGIPDSGTSGSKGARTENPECVRGNIRDCILAGVKDV